MRGKVSIRRNLPRHTGITPAYAGKSTVQTIAAFEKLGSPPPMRGKAGSTCLYTSLTGITPAYAGKSKVERNDGCKNRDHPRLCGEKDELDDGAKTATGSPPPMRGKGFQSGEGQFLIGITPAYAGKSHYWIPESKLEKDHPRLCGEKFQQML